MAVSSPPMLKPGGDVGGVLLARLAREFQMRAKERSSQLGDEFFLRIAFIAPLLAAEIPCKTRRVTRPVPEFMRESGVIALSVTETFKRRHPNTIDFVRIVSTIAAMPDGGLRGGEELVDPIDAGHGIEP